MYQTTVSIASLRKEALSHSEQISQTYFGEQLQLLDKKERWSLVQTEDGYQGWLDAKSVRSIKELSSPLYYCRINSIKAHLYRTPSIYEGPVMSIPFASRVGVLEKIQLDNKERWLKIAIGENEGVYLREKDTCPMNDRRSREECAFLAEKFLYQPYTWGGRSTIDGFDCSGFVQMIYREMGILLPRDAKDQRTSSLFTSINESQLKPCDLIFWENREGRIVHVALFLKKNEFIHATTAIEPISIRKNNLSDPYWNGGERLPRRHFCSLSKD